MYDQVRVCLLVFVHTTWLRDVHPLFSSRSAAHRHLPPFPTRRSSDLRATTRWWACFRPSLSTVSPSWSDPWEDCSSGRDRKSTRLNSSHVAISYAVFCLKKKNSK